MAGAWTTLSVKDGGGTSRTMRAWDESGAGTGPFSFAQLVADASGAGSTPAVKAASTSPGVTDPSLVVALSPNGQDLGSGTGGTRTIRTIVDSSQLSVLGQTTMSASSPVT